MIRAHLTSPLSSRTTAKMMLCFRKSIKSCRVLPTLILCTNRCFLLSPCFPYICHDECTIITTNFESSRFFDGDCSTYISQRQDNPTHFMQKVKTHISFFSHIKTKKDRLFFTTALAYYIIYDAECSVMHL
jgi:hypothetical protein